MVRLLAYPRTFDYQQLNEYAPPFGIRILHRYFCPRPLGYVGPSTCIPSSILKKSRSCNNRERGTLSTCIVGAGLAPALKAAVIESEELCQQYFEHLLSIKPGGILPPVSSNSPWMTCHRAMY